MSDTKLSQQGVVTFLPADTRLPVLLTPQAQADPALRNPTTTLGALANALQSTLPGTPANRQLGSGFVVTAYDNTVPGYVAGTKTLDGPLGLPQAKLCLFAEASVEFGNKPVLAP